MKILFIIISFSLFTTVKAYAQGAVMSFQDGRPAKELSHTNVSGDELLFSSWEPGWAKGKNGALSKALQLKYNVLMDKVFFLGKDDVSMEFTTPVAEFGMLHKGDSLSFRNGFPSNATWNEASFYQVLADGDITLLKKQSKSIEESKSYGSATVEQTIKDKITYYAYDKKQNKIAQVKPNKKAVLELFGGEERTKAEQFIDEAKLNLKKEEDLVKLFKHRL